MTPVKRRLFTIFSALSLLLLVAVILLWVRSHFVSEHIARADLSKEAWVARSSGGAIYFDHRSYWWYQGGWSWGRRRIAFGDSGVDFHYMPPNRGVRFLGFGAFSGTVYTWPSHLYPTVPAPTPINDPNRIDPRWWRDRYRTISLPHWALVLVLGILPFRWYRRAFRERKRARAHLCSRCGYDLRATPERCPECGTVRMAGTTLQN